MKKSRGLLSVVTAVALTFSTIVAPQASAITGIPSGVDVANYQHPGGQGIDWNAVKGSQDFAMVKATEGTTYVNPFYKEDVRAALNAGLKVGAYHYARPPGDPLAQARHFANLIKQVPGQNLPPVLDIEVSEGLSPIALQIWTRAFLVELERLTGKKPMIYTYRYFWGDQMGNTKQFAEYPLWLAAYQSDAPGPVGGWDKLAMWQRSDSGRVAGINAPVDMNLFNGDQGQLNSFAAGNLNATGGKLNGLRVPTGVDLGMDATVLAGAVLALAAGAIAAPALIDAAKKAGLGDGATDFVRQVEKLAKAGEIPTGDVKALAAGDYTVGDLLLLLDNQAHVEGVDVNIDSAQVSQAASEFGIPNLDSTKVSQLIAALR